MCKLYLCKLVHKNTIQESFYKYGESIADLKKELERFQWGKGTWEIIEHLRLSKKEKD